MRGSFYTVEKIGPNRAKTPEGFLLCRDVPVARTGLMIYGPDETPITPGPDGITKIFRGEDQVFRPETIASAMGKSVTNDHPEEDVVPTNWKNLAIGTMMNVRRGDGHENDLLLADLLIMDAAGIAIIEAGKAEVSLGYDADYVEVEPGVGRQEDIYINHVAVVEEGRCGPRCAIRDSKPANLDTNMTTPVKAKNQSVRDSLKRFFTQAFKAKDAAEVEKLVEDAATEMEQADTGDTHVHVHTGDSDEERWSKNDAEHAELRQRIEALEKALASKTGDSGSENPGSEEAKKAEEEAAKKAADAARDEEIRADEMALDEVPEELKEELKKNKDKAKDSAFLGDSIREVASMAEILVPGVQIPTYDTKARPGATVKQLCAFRRSVLDTAYKNEDTARMIDSLLGKKMDTSRMTCDAVRTLFRSAAATQQQLNNLRTTQRGTTDSTPKTGVVTLADINARNAAHWAGKSH